MLLRGRCYLSHASPMPAWVVDHASGRLIALVDETESIGFNLFPVVIIPVDTVGDVFLAQRLLEDTPLRAGSQRMAKSL